MSEDLRDEFRRRIPAEIGGSSGSFQSCALDKTALFLILLIFPKLLLPEMTWQLLRRDVLWFLVQAVSLPELQRGSRSPYTLQLGIIIRLDSDNIFR